MTRHRTLIRLSAALAGVALVWACGGDSPAAPPTPEPARPATVTVSPTTAELTALGATVQLTAEVRDQNARVMAGATVTWSSGDTSVATVDASGLVTAVAKGVATITASGGEVAGSAVVTVTQSVATVEVSPSVAELTALGATVQLTAEAFDANGHAVAGADFSWESSDIAVATVDATGLVTAVAEGTATITASGGSASGSAAIKVVELATLEAYLTQAVQSREHPVPLVAGERALLRIFVTAAHPTTVGIPPVRARFFLNGTERHVADIPATTTPIPTEVVEGDLSSSANVEIPAEIVQPGLEMVIEIDPDRMPDPGLGVARRIPNTGRMAVDVHEMPVFDLTLIPFIWSETHDSSIVDLIGAMEGGSGHYLGMMSRPTTGAHGLANRAARTVFSLPHAFVIGHELGHTMSLDHANCGTAVRGLDPLFPYSGGSIGVWGYDLRDGGRLVPPDYTDLMGYCNQRYWISDYHFAKALRFRLSDERLPQLASRSLLLWGGIDPEGEAFLEPAFVVDAPGALPDSAGEYRITGRTFSGGELFSLSFAMPETADSDGSSSFVFVLPVQPGWEGGLASITLSGPGDSVTLDGESNLPMAILRNPRTGQVRAILRDPPQPDAAAMAPQADLGSLDVLFSRGIPDAAAWGR